MYCRGPPAGFRGPPKLLRFWMFDICRPSCGRLVFCFSPWVFDVFLDGFWTCLLGWFVSSWGLVPKPDEKPAHNLFFLSFPEEKEAMVGDCWRQHLTCSRQFRTEAFISGLSDMRRGAAMCSAALPMKAMGWAETKNPGKSRTSWEFRVWYTWHDKKTKNVNRGCWVVPMRTDKRGTQLLFVPKLGSNLHPNCQWLWQRFWDAS